MDERRSASSGAPGDGAELPLAGQGTPLDPATIAFFEPRLGYRLDRVRVHDDAATRDAAALLRARAFTVGDRIGLGAGTPPSTTPEGRFVLGHELAHIGDLYAGRLRGLRGVSDPTDPHEVEARRNAWRFGSPAWGDPKVAPAPSVNDGELVSLLEITLNTGVRIADTSVRQGDNIREDVLYLLDRLHTLWALTNAQYDDQYRYVHALPRGSAVPMSDPSPPAALTRRGVSSPWSFQPTFDAIRRNREPTLAAAVFQRYTAIPLSDGVGRGSRNKREDVLAVILRLGMLNLFAVDFRAEHRAVSALLPNATVPDATIPRTLEAITLFKVRIAEGKLGREVSHRDEAEYGGADRFAGRSIEVPGPNPISVRPGGTGQPQNFTKIFAVFIPRGVPPTENKVHLFFTPFLRPMEFLVQQGLRAQHENSEWILIGVPALGESDRPNVVTIDTAEIQRCLLLAGRASTITAIRMSAHSRGQRGLAHTLGVGSARPLIDLGLVEGITIFDASYRTPGAAIRSHLPYLTRLRDPADRRRFRPGAVRLYDVTVANVSGLPGTRLDAALIRGLAYVRLLQEGIALNTVGRGVVNQLNETTRAAVNRLLAAIPARGTFSTRSPTPTGMVDVSSWLASHAADLRLADHPTTGLKPLITQYQLDGGANYSRAIDAHHWFVAELAHEAIE